MKPSSAYLLITCNDGKLGEVINQIEPLDGIKEIQGTCGAYDIVAKVESATKEHLQEFFIQKIRTLVDIRSVMMLGCKQKPQ